ncbi:aromatic ring-hydroxylating dioxygenase subunit alpha [Aliterella atlantica]|uniref:Pheophorbide a oxygenase n=1 Tax=Aliterella atlantica CENA595 TaxID=1618023 RepID=A0A0D8ZTZ2_9CYAN|nr:Rieske 2Fe-2S domain-containing protein [Aliterella atlantica]KJH71939.1 Pheophorbide a oxygenase [Aliterella atlantica CENA595]
MEPEFDFFQHWYPLLPIEDLDPKQPTTATLLGLRLVIWKPKASDFRVFLDSCPHRLAPLSQGRIDDRTGNLMCSYHGWQFDEQGICTHIPQAEDPEIVSKQKDNLCAVSLPVRQQQDLLWVWLDANSSAQADSTPLPLSPQIDADKGFVWSSFVRDLEYDWQTLVENVADPSHVPFAHHGVQGDRNKATPMLMEIERSQPNLIVANVLGRLSSTITFEPPCRLEYALKFGDGSKQFGLVTYCLPVSPGKSRIVVQFPRNFAKTLHHLTPRWWEHINIRNQVLDGDMVLLQQQEHFLQQRQLIESWKTAYKLPTSADRFVIEFRKWFDKYSHGQLPWSKVGLNVPQTWNNHDRAQILDRYNQHTRHCSSCSRTLLVVQRLQILLLIYFALTVSAVALLPDAWKVKLGLPLIVTAILGLGAYAWLKFWLSPKFYFVDYIHAQK